MEGKEGVRIIFGSRFLRVYKKLPPETQKKIEVKSGLLRINHFHPSLHAHKLHGELTGFWAFSVAHDCRIIFLFLDDGNILYESVGSHDLYDRL